MRRAVVFSVLFSVGIQVEPVGNWPTTDWVAECLPVDPEGYAGCSPDSEFASDVISQLRGSSLWLEGLGYEEPAIERDFQATDLTRPWKVYLGGVFVCGKNKEGKPDGAACYRVEEVIEGVAAQLQAPGGNLKATPGLGREAIKIGTDVRDSPEVNASAPTHELFHGVQASYGLTTNKGAWMWFIEGTAAAIEEVHYRTLAGPKDANGAFSIESDKFGNVLLSGRGFHDSPLDDLRNWMKPHYKIYTSYLFWLFVGDALSPGSSPQGLRKLMEALDANGRPAQSIDEALKKFGRGGLANYYPDYIAKRGDEFVDYELHVRPLAVSDGTDEEKKDESEELTVRRLAARYHLVSADPKSAENARLEIRVESEDSDALHLIVDSDRYDGGTGSLGTEKNIFRTSLKKAKEFKVRVANVADDAGATKDQTYKLQVRLVTEEPDCCSCGFTATKTFFPQDDFQCSFAYPAHWEAQYDKWENVVYVTAPRCEHPCDGARSMSFSISTGRDKYADDEEQAALTQGIVTRVGSVSCGGREGPAFRPPGTTPEGRAGLLSFHVGNNDGRAYDARAQFSCSVPGEWLDLEELFLGSVK